MTAPDLDALDRAIASATPDVDADDHRLVRELYRVLASGRPGHPGAVAAAVGLRREEVEARLAAWPGVFLDGDAVVGFWGLALPAMPHRMAFRGGATVHAWCAWDPLFIAPIVGQATVVTTDPVSGSAITYTVGPDGVDRPAEGQVLSFLEPDGSWGEDVLTTFCHHVLHFTGRDTGEAWVAEHPGTFLLTLADAAELGRRHARRVAGSVAAQT